MVRACGSLSSAYTLSGCSKALRPHPINEPFSAWAVCPTQRSLFVRCEVPVVADDAAPGRRRALGDVAPG